MTSTHKKVSLWLHSYLVRKRRIREIERDIVLVLSLIDFNADSNGRMRLWRIAERLRDELEFCCGADLKSQLLRAGKLRQAKPV